ncbi:MAG: addiction module protein [Planctomycetota bacterium]
MEQIILEKEALRLPVHERVLLVDALIGSLDDDAARRIEAAWAQEAEARREACLRGEIQALDGPSVLRELRARYGK